MATVAPAPAPRTKFDARVEAEIGKAVGRIRANDLLLGGLAAAVLVLAYTLGMVLLDRWLVLPMAARQATLAGFGLALGAVGYLFVVRPLRRAVNPRYAARRVEATVADSKNAVINWVDLQERDLPATVRAAVSQRAAGNLQAADVTKATEAKPVVWLGATAGLLAAALAVLFVILKPAPFASLVKRTFSPFVAREIATRTTLTLTEPAGGDVTVTAGESMTVAVDVGGSVPADGPNRVRLQLWHTDGQAEVDELPLEPGTGNDWRLTVPPSVIQNGFQYRVVGGDTHTGDYRVTVRTRPLVTGFEARYESPAYTRIPVEVGREPKLEGYRGTRVTLTARTNRPLKRGWMQVEGRPDPLPATVVGDNRDGLQFELTLADSGSYRLGFTSASDETTEPTPPYPIKVLTDQPPTLTISTPTLPAPGEGAFGRGDNKHEGESPKTDPDTITLPANGTLAVDGEAADDFGLASVVLRMRVVSGVPFGLQPKPYRGGKSFRRADGTFPTRLADADGSETGYRDTVALTELKDATGRPVQAEPDMVIEYWLEATDNCEPKPNVGASAHKRLRLTPAVTELAKKQELDRQAAARKADQQKHEQAQDKQFQGEKREPKQLRPEDKPPQADPGQPGEPQPQENNTGKPENGGQPQTGDKPQPGQKQDGAKPPAEQQPQPKGSEQTGEPQPGGTDPNPAGDQPPAQPKSNPDKQSKGAGEPKANGQPGGKAERSPQERKLEEQANKVEQAIREQGGGKSPETAPQPKSADGQSPPSDAAEKERQRQTQQAIDDLSSDDPSKQQAARDKLDQTVGEQERQRIEKLQKDLTSDDPDTRKKAEKELGELDRETGAGGAGVRGNRQEDVERLSRELNSQNPTTKKNAERRAERDFGKQGRDQLQQTGDKLNSSDKQKQEEGKKDVDELMKKEKNKPKEPPAGGDQQPNGDKPSPADQVRQQANDLNSPDLGKKDAAEKAMDGKMGTQARKDLQDKLGSSDPKQQEAGKQQVEQMARQAGDAGQRPSREQMKELTDAANDLNSPDPAKQQAAQDKLDKQLGEAGRQQLERDLKDAQSGDPAKQQTAQQRMQDAAKKMGGEGQKSPEPLPKGPTKKQIDQAAETARDLTSPDKAKREAAEKKLDAQMGKEKREQLQKNLDDLKNGTPEQQADATKQLGQLAKDAAEKAGQKPPTPEQMKELADAAKDLNNSDPAKKQTAEKKLDQAVGQPAREQMQKEQVARQPDPKSARDATERAMAGDKGSKPDPAAIEQKMKELTDAAKDLNSPDEAKKQDAEKKLDEQIGEQARKQVQQLQNDLKSPDAKTREAAQQRLKEAMDKLKGRFDPKQPWRPDGSGGTDTDPGKKYDDDPANRLKAAELQLKTFKETQGNEKVLKKAGFTPEEYNSFLRDLEKRVEQLRQEVAKPRTGPAAKPVDGPPTVQTAGGAGKVEKKDSGPATGGAAAGAATPGYGDAQKRFAAQAAKGGKKPADPSAPKQP